MKISFIVDSLSYGGAGRVVSIIANSLISKGHEVTIVLLYDNYHPSSSYSIEACVKVYSILVKQKTNRWYDYVKYIRHINQNRRIDVCIAFLNVFAEYASVACMFSKTKLICCERNDPNNSPTAFVYRFLRNPLYFFSDRLIFQTKDMQLYFPKAIQKKSKIIFNPVNPALNGKNRAEGRSKMIISVGKLTEQKNYFLALKGFKLFHEKHKEYMYYICGEGLLREKITNMIHELELDNSVVLLGNVQDVFKYLEQSEIFVMSSAYEGMPNALMEAMAMGIPSVSTDHPIGGAKELIHHGYNGFLIPLNDEKALAHCLTLLSEDDDLYNRISYNSKSICEEYSESTIIKQWEDAIIEVYNE